MFSNNLQIFLPKTKINSPIKPNNSISSIIFLNSALQYRKILLSTNNLTKQLSIKEDNFMSHNNNKNNQQKLKPSTQFTQSNYSVTPDQLENLYQEHWQMKEEIQSLKKTLYNCENKWNMIVNSLLKQNVQLKASEEYYKSKYHHLQQKILSKRHKKHPPPTSSQQLSKDQQLQLKLSSHPSTLSSYNLSTVSNPNSQSPQNPNFNDTQISSVQNLWKNHYFIDDNEQQHSFNNTPNKAYQ